MEEFMNKKSVWVISLGGSRIVPDDVDEDFLKRFKKLIDSHEDKKFVVVCGGGRTARRYILALRKLGKGVRDQSGEGIAITRLHAGFMTRLFGSEANEEVPRNMKRVAGLLKKNRVVFCGALRYTKKNTSDGTAARVASYLKCAFINLTNVKGLYDKDPKESPLDSRGHRTGRGAKFISRISWSEFYSIASRIKYEAGQHFVLDKLAARIIRDKKIDTYIVGSLDSMDKVLDGKPRFGGTLISG
jgi:uridylate kinase